MKNKLIKKLNDLKNQGVVGIKQSFEDEGVIYDDLVSMRRITDICSLPMYVKIGGCEAKSDVNTCIALGIDCVIGPMIESSFAMSKFINMANKNINMMFVCETVLAYQNLESMLTENDISSLSGMVFGRSDFVKSMGKPKSEVDSYSVSVYIENAMTIAKQNNLITTMGGNLSTKSSEFIKKLYEKRLLDRIETRNVIIELNDSNTQDLTNTIQRVLDFELSWLENKQEKYGDIVEDCRYRSELLRNRK